MTRVKLALLITMPIIIVTQRLPCMTPREIVKVPIRIRGQDKVPHREGEEVHDHPPDVRHLAGSDDDEEAGETEDDGEQDERDGGVGPAGDDGLYDEVDGEGDSGGEDECADELHAHDELHGETERPAEITDEEEFS